MGTDLASRALVNRLAEYERRLDRLERYAASGKFLSYTPTLGGTGWAIGDGTRVGGYVRLGNFVHFWARIIFGASSTYGAANRPTVSLPVNAKVASTAEALLLTGHAFIGASVFPLFPRASGTPVSVVEMYAGLASGTYVSQAAVSSTVPGAWANGDKIFVRGMYEAVE